MCDSYNDESARQCYVCGQLRSAESIREGLIREREERLSRINDKIYKYTYSILRIVFVSALTASLVIIGIAIIIKIINRQLDDIWRSTTFLTGHIIDNLRISFLRNPSLLFIDPLSGSLADFAANTQVLWIVMTMNFSPFLYTISEVFPQIILFNFKDSCQNGMVPVLSRFLSKFGVIGVVIAGLISAVRKSIEHVVKVVYELFNSVFKHFN